MESSSVVSGTRKKVFPLFSAARVLIPLLSGILFLCCGCGAMSRNTVNQQTDTPEEIEKAINTRGEISAILLPGCASEPGTQDTLFSCLKLSRDVRPDSVKLPADEKIYLGHVAEFIVRALKYYQLRESFRDFYGHRIVFKFRKLTPGEMRSKKFADYSRFTVGTISTVAGVVTMMPVGVVLFLADGIKAEIDRQDFEDRTAKMELPTPKKNVISQKLESAGRTLLYFKEAVAETLSGKKSEVVAFDDKIAGYLVEECVLEKVSPEALDQYRQEVLLFKQQNPSPTPISESTAVP
ncbi:MAG TPA: hypothetical protein PLT45_10770 [Smithella sp.]|nr:hypothetical protein [Smithella sp.]